MKSETSAVEKIFMMQYMRKAYLSVGYRLEKQTKFSVAKTFDWESYNELWIGQETPADVCYNFSSLFLPENGQRMDTKFNQISHL